MQHEPDGLDDVPRILHNERFYAIARISMIVASVVGLPIAGGLLTRIVSQADAITSQVQEQNVALKILSVTVSEKLNSNFTTLTDHELRLRALEKSK